jgi:rare lipoprotein A
MMKIPRIAFSMVFSMAFCVFLASCGGQKVKPEPKRPAPPSASQTPIQSPAPSAPADTSSAAPGSIKNPEKGSGGYYLDDGPHEIIPANLDQIPDATPRIEELSSRSNRPYSVFGKRYVPMQGYQPYKASGIASWYGKRFHGKKTSNGEVYDMYAMSGAHTTLPLPSYLRVTNPDNGRSVVIRINDRGPFHNNRLIDLSYAAAHKLGLVSKGSGRVEIEAIDSRAAAPAPEKEPSSAIIDVNLKQPEIATSPAIAAPIANIPGRTAFVAGSYVQVGAFKYENNAEGLRQKLLGQALANDGSGKVPVTSWYNDGIYRVRLGPYSNHASATESAARIKRTIGAKAIVIVQD